MKTKISLVEPKQQLRNIITFIALTALFVVCAVNLDLNLPSFLARFSNVGRVFGNFMALNFADFGEILAALLSSIFMAIGGLLLGTVISFVFSFLAANTIAPSAILATIIKAFVSIIRAVPALVWILIIVASIGFGNTAGIVGLMIPTIGYLTKSFISSIEEQDPAIIETLKSTGANWFQIVAEGVLPCVALAFSAWISIRLESNIAESISIGMVGAGGIGSLLSKATSQYDYPTITTIILTIFITMLTFELIITAVKRKIR